MWGRRRGALVVVLSALLTAGVAPPARAAGIAGAPQSVRTSYADGRLSVAWSAPVDDGGDPVEAYDLTLKIGSTSSTRRLTGTSFATAAPAGATVTVQVSAVTSAGNGDEETRTSTADVGEVVALDGTGHVRRRYLESGTWQSLGGPAMTGTPFLTRSAAGLRLVVAGDSEGRIWGWTSTSGWRVMSATRCRWPAAGFSRFRADLTLACVGADGRLLAANVEVSGSTVPTDARFSAFGVRPAGRLAAVRSAFVFRTATADGAGHNVLAFEPFGAGATRLPLRCAADPGAGTGGTGTYDSDEGWAACLMSSTRVGWVQTAVQSFHTPYRTTGNVALPFTARGQVSLFVPRFSNRGLIAVAGADGLVRELDTAVRTWRTAGGLAARPGLSVLQLRG